MWCRHEHVGNLLGSFIKGPPGAAVDAVPLGIPVSRLRGLERRSMTLLIQSATSSTTAHRSTSPAQAACGPPSTACPLARILTMSGSTS
jgi:hypothetical protein